MVSEKLWWGRSLSLDLHECDNKKIKDPVNIRDFVRRFCSEIGMKRHGPTEVERFGHGKLRGYSMMQFIETSSVSAHFDEIGNRAFIDVFSCKKFDPKKAAEFCKRFFGAKNMSIYVEERI